MLRRRLQSQISHTSHVTSITESATAFMLECETVPSCRPLPLGSGLAPFDGVSSNRRFVYVLKNGSQPPRYYTGLTSDVTNRLACHNNGRSPHTASGRPWHVDVVVEFADEHRATAFERYLKSGSGSAFAKRHLR